MNPINGRLSIQPVRFGLFELRDASGVSRATCGDENAALALLEAYNTALEADSVRLDITKSLPKETYGGQFHGGYLKNFNHQK